VFCEKNRLTKKYESIRLSIMSNITLEDMKTYSDIAEDNLTNKIDTELKKYPEILYHNPCKQNYLDKVKKANKINVEEKQTSDNEWHINRKAVILNKQFLYLDNLIVMYKEKLGEHLMIMPYIRPGLVARKIFDNFYGKVNIVQVKDKTIVYDNSIDPYIEYEFEHSFLPDEKLLHR
jgi:hypothetical protein